MTESLDTLTFLPWEGKVYATQGIAGTRLLILGESHYFDKPLPVSDSRTFTQYSIRTWAMPSKKTARVFTIAERAVLRAAGLTGVTREEFWNSVSFYNYLTVVLRHPREQPQPETWAHSADQFRIVLDAVAPQAVLVLGKRLLAHLSSIGIAKENGAAGGALAGLDVVSATGVQIPAEDITHPSGGGFKYANACPAIERLLGRARRRAGDRLS